MPRRELDLGSGSASIRRSSPLAGNARIVVRVAAFLCWLLLCGGRAIAATDVWIDSDPAIGVPWREVDDAFALILAFHSPEVRIAGISSTYGNASVARTTEVARDIVQRFGALARLQPSDVYMGAASPRDLPTRTEATEALARELRKRKLTYLALGPLTNLAAFLHLHPELAGRIKRVVFVGGRSSDRPLAFGPTRSWHVHDANASKDPAAVAVVLRTSIPITLADIEVGPELALTREDMQRLRRSGATGDFLWQYTRAWLWFWTSIVKEKGGLAFDVLAVLPTIRSDLLATRKRYAYLDAAGNLLAQSAPERDARQVQFATGVGPSAKRLLVRRLQLSDR